MVVAKSGSYHPGMRRVSLSLLGSFELQVDEEPRTVSIPAQRLLAMLALDHGKIMERSYVAGTLWPDSTDTAARSNLRSALSSLGPMRRIVVGVVPGRLQLAEQLHVDLHEYREKAHDLLDRSGDTAPISAFAFDLLPHWDEAWVEPERESFRQLRLHILEHLSERFTRLGRFAEAMEAALLAVEGAPLRESAHRALIRALAAEGNRGEAMSRYALLREMLDRELGVEPSFEIDDVLGEASSSESD